jgi:hypothetical protein
VKDLTMHDKNGKKKLNNIIKNILIYKKENYMIHNLVVKSLRRMILRRKNIKLWR